MATMKGSRSLAEIVKKLHSKFLEDCHFFLRELFEPLSARLDQDVSDKQPIDLNNHLVEQLQGMKLPICVCEITQLCLLCQQYREFKREEQKLFLVLGGSCSGKTTTSMALAQYFWRKLEADKILDNSTILPIFISLPKIKYTSKNSILSTFLQNLCSVDDLYNIQRQLKIVLILDAFEHIAKTENNDDCIDIWNFEECIDMKIVVFLRPEIFPSTFDRQKHFLNEFKGLIRPAKEYHLQPYNNNQISAYVENFVEYMNDNRSATVKKTEIFEMAKHNMQKCNDENGLYWSTSRFLWWLQLEEDLSPLPNLKELARTPFLLTLILVLLPGIVKKQMEKQNDNDMLAICRTEEELYSQLFSQWFEFNTEKVTNSQFPKLFGMRENLSRYFRVYAMNLAESVLKNCHGVLNENYLLKIGETLEPSLCIPIHDEVLLQFEKSDERYKNVFSDLKNVKLLRSSCLLRYSYQYDPNRKIETQLARFLHISILEYFVSQDVFSGLRAKLNYHVQNATKQPSDVINIMHKPIFNVPNNEGIFNMLVDRAKTDESFRNLLLTIVAKSAEITLIKQMAANAMTILNYSGFNFSGMDLRNVQIEGADLSQALMAQADLRGANLRNANFYQSWLAGCRFEGSLIEGISLGEKLLDGCGTAEHMEGKVWLIKRQLLFFIRSFNVVIVDLRNGNIIYVCESGFERNVVYSVFTEEVAICQVFPSTKIVIKRWNIMSKQEILPPIKIDPPLPLVSTGFDSTLHVIYKSSILIIATVMPVCVLKIFHWKREARVLFKPITCLLIDCDVFPDLDLLLLITDENIRLYCLATGKLRCVYLCRKNVSTLLESCGKFHPSGNFVFLASQKQYLFNCYYTKKPDVVFDVCENFAGLFPPRWIEFNNDGSLMTTQHLEQTQRELIIWEVLCTPATGSVSMLQLRRIRDTSPLLMGEHAFPVMYALYNDDKGRDCLLYYNDYYKGHINQVVIKNTDSAKSRGKLQIDRAEKFIVSSRGNKGAFLLRLPVNHEEEAENTHT